MIWGRTIGFARGGRFRTISGPQRVGRRGMAAASVPAVRARRGDASLGIRSSLFSLRKSPEC